MTQTKLQWQSSSSAAHNTLLQEGNFMQQTLRTTMRQNGEHLVTVPMPDTYTGAGVRCKSTIIIKVVTKSLTNFLTQSCKPL